MTPRLASLALVLCFGASPALAQQDDAHAGHHSVAAAEADLPDAARDAVAVVDRFGIALAKADMATVTSLLAPDVLVLESGGAERSREEYLGHHAGADAKFLAGAHVQPVRRRARIEGDLAWVGSESEIHASADGKPLTLLSTETMVLRRTAGGWRIVHIHWSSRPKKD